jgi:hypothetical protein
MVWQRLRLGLLTGAILATAGITVRAGDGCAPAPGEAPSAPATRKVCVKEWVPESYQTTRTVCKIEQRQETYTAYRTETVPETRTRTCTVNRLVQETVTKTRNVCVCVPVVEERTVMQTHVSYKPVTKMVSKWEDHGHYECREVECGPSLHDRLKKCFHHRNGCCDSCEPCCVRTKTVKVWVPCKVCVQVPVTCCQRVCEQRPVVCKVTTYKTETRTESYPCTITKCIPETKTETYTVNVCRQVPYQATRTICVSVPHTETVTCTRMVCRTVEKEVPCETACAAPCCCETCSARKCHSFSLRSLFHHRNGDCDSGCCH